nr:Ig domain-containing protein [Flavobacteriaceae bacterium]
TKQAVAVVSVSLDKTTATITVDDKLQLTPTVAPNDATNKGVTWSSSDETVATVDENGKVTALKAGKTIITVNTKDGNKTATCEVTVNAKEIKVTSVLLDKTTANLVANDTNKNTVQVIATVKPDNATNKNITWTSDNTNVATVDANGLVTAVGKGTATITVTTEDGQQTATCVVTVTETKVFILPDLDVINHWYDNIVAFEDARTVSERTNASQGYNPQYSLKNDELFKKLYYWTWYGSYQNAELYLKDGVTEAQQTEYEEFLEANGFVRDTSVSWKQWINAEKHIVTDYLASKRKYRFFARLFDLPPKEKLGATITPDELKAWETNKGGSTTSDGSDGSYWFVVDKTKSKESVIYRNYWFNKDKTMIDQIDIYYRNYELFVDYSSSGAYPLNSYFVKLAKEKDFEHNATKDKLMQGNSGEETDSYYFKNSSTNMTMKVVYYHKYKNCSVSYW